MSVLERERAGVFDGVPDTEYHGADWAVSSTTLKTLFKADAQTARWNLDHPADSSTFAFGRFFHSHVLEGGPVPQARPDMRTKAGKAKAAELAEAGVPLLSASEVETFEQMAASVKASQLASGFLKGGKAERSIFWKDDETGVWCKARPDYLSPFACVDLKTTQDAHPLEFSRSAAQLAYDIQAAFYLRGILAATGELPLFVFVAVGKTAPYQTSVHALSDVQLERADELVSKLLWQWKGCLESGNYPGIQDSLHTFSFPQWEETKRERWLS